MTSAQSPADLGQTFQSVHMTKCCRQCDAPKLDAPAMALADAEAPCQLHRGQSLESLTPAIHIPSGLWSFDHFNISSPRTVGYRYSGKAGTIYYSNDPLRLKKSDPLGHMARRVFSFTGSPRPPPGGG
jgi:hypothetical protein